MKKIAVIGSYAVGMTICCDHFPVGGETVPGNKFQAMHGGKGSNQAVAAARMGAEVLFGSCVGQDSFGDQCFKLYEQEHIDATYVKRSQTGQSTGVGLIYVNSEGENEIVIDFAANNELTPEDIEAMMPQLKQCELVLMQLEIDLKTVAYTAKRCHEEGILFVLNPAPFRELPEGVLENCDYVTPNQTEARLLLGLTAADQCSDEEVARQIHEKGAQNVIVTLGEGGAMIVNDTLCMKVPGIQVQAVDTTGAGDTFSAAFCVALAEGRSLEDAVRFGNTAAGLAVTKYGVIEAIPYRRDVENYSNQ
ncbi:MAG: ribokinase [Lachnospiraceae bacterium]|uniref:ribokinase n=1 Tax=Parablautia sp. Marseille-Q6255 TaxID=3039593 RepID=UPI0024BC0408|nr:ribokinase [Parablautia sp. Marseille-Q6255]